MRGWVLQRFPAYGRALLIAAASLPPLVFYNGANDAFGITKLSAIYLLGILGFACWLMWSAERRVWVPKFRIMWAAAAFLSACILATIFSDSPVVSLVGIYQRYGGLIPLVLYATIMFLVVAFHWERPETLEGIVWGSAVAATIMGLYVLIQAAGLDWIEWQTISGTGITYPIGTMGNSNFAGAYLAICLPFTLHLSLNAKDFVTRRFFVFTALLILAALWLTQTRGGLLAAGVALAVMAFIHRDRLPVWTKGAAYSLVAAAAVLVLVVFWHPWSERPPEPLSRISLFRTESAVERKFYWRTAWHMFLANPVVGTGMDTYAANYHRYRSPEDAAQFGLGFSDKPHNIFLEYAANAGVLGVGGFLLLAALALRYGFGNSQGLPEPRRALAGAFTAALVAYLTQGFFSINEPPLALMGWMAVGGIAALADPAIVAARGRLETPEQKRKPRSSKGSRAKAQANPHTLRSGPAHWPVHVGSLVVAAVLLAVGFRPLWADMRIASAYAKSARGAPILEAQTDLIRAAKLYPLEPQNRSLLGYLAEQRASAERSSARRTKRFLVQALEHYLDAHRLQPNAVGTILSIAGVHSLLGAHDVGHYAEADRWMRRALARDRADWELHERYAEVLEAWAKAVQDLDLWRRTAVQLEEAVRIRPDRVSSWVKLGATYRTIGQNERAQTALRRALSLDPQNREALELADSLRDK